MNNNYRSKMAIISQEPFLFDDTVEKNLDPEELYTTFELLDVLEKCHLAQVTQKLGRSFYQFRKSCKLECWCTHIAKKHHLIG